MGSGGGSKGVIDVLDVATNIGTLGLVGYDENGFRAGGVVHAIDEGLGEITSRNLAREQMNITGERLAQEEENQRVAMLREQRQRENEDRAASSGVQAIRNTARVQGGGRVGARTLGASGGSSDERDFLGL